MRVDTKTNEHKAALQLLGILPREGKVLTSDAMFTHRDFAQEVCDQGGECILFAKTNQPFLKEQIQSAFGEEEDFPPTNKPTKTEANSGANGYQRRKRTRSVGNSMLEKYDDSQRVFGLAGGRPSL